MLFMADFSSFLSWIGSLLSGVCLGVYFRFVGFFWFLSGNFLLLASMGRKRFFKIFFVTGIRLCKVAQAEAALYLLHVIPKVFLAHIPFTPDGVFLLGSVTPLLASDELAPALESHMPACKFFWR